MRLMPQSVSRKVGRKVLLLKKNSPHLFFVGGVVGVVGSAVLACRATLKLEEKLDGIKKDVDAVTPINITVEIDKDSISTDDDRARDFGYVCVKSVGVLGRLYGPSIVLGAVSVAALTGSHVQLSRRNAALTVTLAAATKAYDEYRLRVQQEIGKARELDIHRAVTEETVEVDGKKKLVKTVDPDALSEYARIFDESNPNWVNNAEMNRMFLQVQQNWANHLLRSRGHVFLNEVYDQIGFEHTSAGQVVGWIINGNGDGYVDFGLFEEHSRPFVIGQEKSIILDFNVDGVVYHLLDGA